MHEVLVNRLGGLSLPKKSVVRLTDRPDMTLDVYCGRKTTIQPAKACLISSTKKKNFIVFGYKVIKHLTSRPFNELVKVTVF